jgi:hypothetical protein
MDGLPSLQVRTLIRWMKDSPCGAIPISSGQMSLGCLRAVTSDDAACPELLRYLCDWHRSLFAAFAVPFPVSASGARGWLTEQILEAPERLLFWVRDVAGRPVGHIGLFRFDFVEKTVQLRDVVCGVRGAEDVFAVAIETLKQWVSGGFEMAVVDAAPSRRVA